MRIVPAAVDAPEVLLNAARTPDQRPVWRFPGADIAAVREMFSRAALSEREFGELFRPGNVALENGGITVLPSLEMLLGMSDASRRTVYAALAKNGANPYHQFPLLISGEVERWCDQAQVVGRSREIIGRLVWRKGTLWAFSDVSVLIQSAQSAAEISMAKRLMYRAPTLRVMVGREAHLSSSAFAGYWNPQGRNSEAAPAVRMASEWMGTEWTDVISLLPALAREKLYSYASLSDAVGGRFPDCNWTSLNFFSDDPQPYYLDSKSSFLELTQNYERIDRPAMFGDLACFVGSNGEIVHTCVYIAADVVFTKNGQTLLAPWLLMRLGDVDSIYGTAEGRTVQWYRQKTR